MKYAALIMLLASYVNAQEAPKVTPIDPSTMELLKDAPAFSQDAQKVIDDAILAQIYASDQQNPQRQTNCI
jgi:hypothetical protein